MKYKNIYKKFPYLLSYTIFQKNQHKMQNIKKLNIKLQLSNKLAVKIRLFFFLEISYTKAEYKLPILGF